MASVASQCAVLGQLWITYQNTKRPEWREFIDWAEFGLPLAYFRWQEYSELLDSGEQTVEAAWFVFCSMLAIDPDEEYENLAEALAASPNPPPLESK